MVSVGERALSSGLSGEKGCFVKMEMKPLVMLVSSEGRDKSLSVLVQMGLWESDEGERHSGKENES